MYVDLRDRQRVCHLLMIVRDEFESIRSFLHDTVIKDFISEKARLDNLQAKQTPSSTDVVLATQLSPKFAPSAQTSPVSLLRIHLDHLKRTFAITTKSMVKLSLSVTNYSLSNLLDKALHSNLLVLLLLSLLKSLSKEPPLNSP